MKYHSIFKKFSYFQAPDPEDVIPYHFIAFVCKDGCLYELGEERKKTVLNLFKIR